MQSFEWMDATSLEDAAAASGEAGSFAKGGGLDLLDLMKEGVLKPKRLVNLRTIAGLDVIDDTRDGLRIGALVTLNAIDTFEGIRSKYVALADAAGHAATPQVRNAATIGGNLLQRPRCWYYRHDFFHEVEPGSHDKRVREGQNQYHAIFDNAQTAMAQASTPATALVAYDASVQLEKSGGATRTAKLSEFFKPATIDVTKSAAAIEPGELIRSVTLPALPPGTKAAYHKQGERESYDWPICDVAVVLQMNGQAVQQASIVMGWVAPTPRHAVEAEQLLKGKVIDDKLAADAAEATVAKATPLSKNAYKVDVLRAVLKRTILAAARA